MAHKTTPKPALSASERAAIKRLISQLKTAGRDVESVMPLIEDWARLGSRDTALSRKEARSKGKEQDAVTRSLNAVQIEKRKLYKKIWQGVTPEDLAAATGHGLSEDEIRAARLQIAADEAWRRRLYRGEGMTEQDLHALYGPPSWHALTEPTIEDDVEAWLEIERSHLKGRTPFRQWNHIKLWLSENPKLEPGRRAL